MRMRRKPLKAMIILSALLVLGSLGLYSAFCGDLEPTAAPGATMYTLEEMYNYRVWRMLDKTFVTHPNNSRFAVHDPVTPGDPEDDLVLDKETGLIWARVPGGQDDFYDAVIECRNVDLGDRKGWRLPSVEELSSLIDMSVAGPPKLPAGHPFVDVENDFYWTDPTTAGSYVYAEYGDEALIYVVNMGDGTVNIYDDIGGGPYYLWPVWGGKSVGF